MRKYIEITCLVIITGMIASCDKFLDIRPESEMSETDLFKTENGFMDALYGVYVNMAQPDLYAGVFSTMNETMGNMFTPVSAESCLYSDFIRGDFKTMKCTGIADNVWMRMYYTIGLANNLIKHLYAPEAKNICTHYNYLLGEALGLRAYLHYDLLRSFAPNIKTMPDYVALPYRKTFSNDIEPQLTVRKFMERVLVDLDSARLLLKDDIIRTNTPEWLGMKEEGGGNTDHVTGTNDIYYLSSFLKKRKFRMNYYAVTAALARVHLDLGTAVDKEKAYQHAKEVIDCGKFRYSLPEHLSSPQAKYVDELFTDEMVFALFSQGVDEYFKGLYDISFGPSKLKAWDVRGVYENNANDFRYSKWFDWNKEDFYLTKHKNELEYSKDIVRMLTLAEMCYIAAEARPVEAPGLLTELLEVRRVDCRLSPNSSEREVLLEIIKEYRKEFFGEGYVFWLYKRLMPEHEEVLRALGVTLQNRPQALVLPLPENEIKYGDRVSEIWNSEK